MVMANKKSNKEQGTTNKDEIKTLYGFPSLSLKKSFE